MKNFKDCLLDIPRHFTSYWNDFLSFWRPMIICEGEKNIHLLVRHYLRILHRTYLQLATLAILADKLNFHLCLLSIGQNSSGLLKDLACEEQFNQSTSIYPRYDCHSRSCPSWNRHWIYWLGVFSRWRSNR